MNQSVQRVVFLLVATGLASAAQAVEVELADWGLNIDGTTYCDLGPCDFAGGGTLPGSVNASGFDFNTGFGNLVLTIGGAGSHSVDFFSDQDIDAAINTFFNEIGSATNAPAAGESWEIDEPGFVFGDIYDNFLAGTLDNSNGLLTPEDVSMALGWDFILSGDEIATMEFLITDVMPTSGFFLSQFDPDSEYTLYLTSSLNIDGGGGGVPEPGTIVLVGIGLLALVAARRLSTREPADPRA